MTKSETPAWVVEKGKTPPPLTRLSPLTKGGREISPGLAAVAQVSSMPEMAHPGQHHRHLMFINTLELGLPMNLDYLTCDFQRNIDQDLHEAEK